MPVIHCQLKAPLDAVGCLQEREKRCLQLDTRRLEEGEALLLDFGKLKKVAASEESVIPVAVQDTESGKIPLIGYANRAALDCAGWEAGIRAAAGFNIPAIEKEEP